jgi:hypothetical protein
MRVQCEYSDANTVMRILRYLLSSPQNEGKWIAEEDLSSIQVNDGLPRHASSPFPSPPLPFLPPSSLPPSSSSPSNVQFLSSPCRTLWKHHWTNKCGVRRDPSKCVCVCVCVCSEFEITKQNSFHPLVSDTLATLTSLPQKGVCVCVCVCLVVVVVGGY